MPGFASDAQTHIQLPCTGKSSKNHLESLDSRTLFQFLHPAWGSAVTAQHCRKPGIYPPPWKSGDLLHLWQAFRLRDGKNQSREEVKGNFKKGKKGSAREQEEEEEGSKEGGGCSLPAAWEISAAVTVGAVFGTTRVFRGTGRAVKSPPASRNPPSAGCGAGKHGNNP